MIRLFVALVPPAPIQSALAQLTGGIPGARWVAEDDFHLTLRFIGEVPVVTADEIADALADVAAPAITMRLHGLGLFDSDRFGVRALWISPDPKDAAHLVQGRVDRALRALELDLDPRKFHPHVTLSRCSRHTAPRDIGHFLAGNGAVATPVFTLTSFHLIQSHLTRDGPVYQTVATYPLERP